MKEFKLPYHKSHINFSIAEERVNGVYKLVAVEKDGEVIPKIKVSGDTIKTTKL